MADVVVILCAALAEVHHEIAIYLSSLKSSSAVSYIRNFARHGRHTDIELTLYCVLVNHHQPYRDCCVSMVDLVSSFSPSDSDELVVCLKSA